MKLRVTIKNSNDIKFYSPDSNWTSFIATIRDVLEESESNLANILVKTSQTIKAAGVVSFEPKIRGDYIIMGEYEKDEKWGWQFKIDGGYENVRLDSGFYDALIIELGEPKGDNWWCVVYPPLCFTSGSQGYFYQSKILDIINDFFKKEK